jgi:hypothetical protein
MQADRRAQRPLRPRDARDMVEVGVRQQDILHRETVLRHRLQQIVHLVAGVNHDPFPGLFAATT